MSDGRITPTHWRALIAAWLGWAFDGLDGYLYIMVATRFVTQLLGKEHPDAEVAGKATIIQGFFLIGWAVGGAVFGRLGDRLGRARTLTLTILTYALFTGLTFFATQWWHVLIFRFIAALGIGGEWAAGSALVSETLHERHRAWASAALQSGYMIGCILAALTSDGMSHLEPRYVFLVGVVPAFVVLWIRRNVPEPEVWASASRRHEPPPLSSLFARDLVGTTLLTTALTSIALTTVWAFLYFMPRTIEKIPEVAAWSTQERARLISNVTIAYFLANIAGNFFGTYLARFAGYRRAFPFFMLASLACFSLGFYNPPTLANVYLVACTTAFFSIGVFGMFPLYIPRLFPTLVRTLGAGFSYNAGRLISGVGAFYGAWITTHAGGPHKAIFWTGLLYIPGFLVALFCPLPKYPLGENQVH